jgi:hypothetical protein
MAGHGVADWATLPDDLIKKIGNIFLCIDDLDYYAVYRQSTAAAPRHSSTLHA